MRAPIERGTALRPRCVSVRPNPRKREENACSGARRDDHQFHVQNLDMTDALTARAFTLGVISAISLPLGAIAAMAWTPRARTVAAMMAFGAGALLAALTIDLVAETLRRGAFYPLATGCLVGCALFAVLNQLV